MRNKTLYTLVFGTSLLIGTLITPFTAECNKRGNKSQTKQETTFVDNELNKVRYIVKENELCGPYNEAIYFEGGDTIVTRGLAGEGYRTRIQDDKILVINFDNSGRGIPEYTIDEIISPKVEYLVKDYNAKKQMLIKAGLWEMEKNK